MKNIILSTVMIVIFLTGCKKQMCGKIQMISTEVSPADGQPLYKLYLESGEVIPTKNRGNYQVGEGYCND